MEKVFLDTNVLLDLLLTREPFLPAIERIIDLSISGSISLYVAPTTITNIHYIVSKLEGKTKADMAVEKMLALVRVEHLNESVIKQAHFSAFKDFEDAVQNFCAEAGGHKIIITRNTKDFMLSKLAIFTPLEYLAQV